MKEYCIDNVPVILISSIWENIGQYKVALKVFQIFKESNMFPLIIGKNMHNLTEEHESLLDIQINNMLEINSYVKNTKAYINKLLIQKKYNVIIFMLPGSLKNPNNSHDYYSEFILFYMLKVFDVDYYIQILPLNYCNNDSIDHQNKIIKKFFSIDTDCFIISNMFCDTTRAKEEKLFLMTASNPIIQNEIDHVSVHKNVVGLNDEHISDLIKQDILKKLTKPSYNYLLI